MPPEAATTEATTTATTEATTAATTAATTETTAAATTDAATTAAATDWRTGLEGEHKEFAARLASPADAVKVALDLRKANSSMIRVPGADAKPEDVEKFRKAIGAATTVEEAAKHITLGREATEADKPVVDAVAKAMVENGVPVTAIAGVTKAVQELAAAQQQQADDVAVAKRGEALNDLRKAWGADFDANVTLANRAYEMFGKDTGLADLLQTTVNGQKLGDHPALTKAFAMIGRRTGEGEFIGAVGATEKASVQSQIEAVLKDAPVGSPAYASKAVQDKLKPLYEALAGSGPATPGFGPRF